MKTILNNDTSNISFFTEIVQNTTNIVTLLNSSTTNSSVAGSHTTVSEVLTTVSKLVCVLVFFVGLIGNSLVLIVFSIRWRHLKPCEVFMVNLACTDFLSTIVTPTSAFIETMGVDFKDVGDVGCKLIHFTIITCVAVSSLTLIGITVDRFVIVKSPLRRQISSKRLWLIVACMWMIGSGPGVVYLHADHVKLHRVKKEVWHCRQWLSLDARIRHTMITFSIQLAVPLLLMVILYSLITYELWKTSIPLPKFHMCEREVRCRYQRNKKSIRLLITIVAVFFVCITPVNTLYILYLFDVPKLPMVKLIRVFTILQMLHMTNSCINPIIYSRLHHSFRKTLTKLFCSRCTKKKLRNYEAMRYLNTQVTSI